MIIIIKIYCKHLVNIFIFFKFFIIFLKHIFTEIVITR